MNVTGKTKIFRKDFNGKPNYSRAISAQEYVNGQKGEWIRTYEQVTMPKGTDIPDKTMVELKGFESLYKTKNGDVRRKMVVTEFRIIEEPNQSQAEFQQTDAEYEGGLPF